MPATPLFRCAVSFLLVANLHGAHAQSGEVPLHSDVTLATPARTCSSALRGLPYSNLDLSRTGTLHYRLVPTDPAHIGKSADIYAAFRLVSQPDKLWLIAGTAPMRLVEYRTGDTPTPLQERTTLAQRADFVVLASPPGETADLSGYIGDGELLFGYGLRAGDQSSAADSFREMLDSKRFHVVWRVGRGPTAYICYRYNRILQGPKTTGSEQF